MTGTQTRRDGRRVAAPYALPAGCAALLLIGAIAAGSHGWLSAGWVLVLAAVVVTAVAAAAEPATTLFVVGAGWLTVAGFSSPPYAQLRVTALHGAQAALVLSLCGLAGSGTGWMVRTASSPATLRNVEVSDSDQLAQVDSQVLAWADSLAAGAAGISPADVRATRPGLRHRWPGERDASRDRGLGRRRQLTGVLLVTLLPPLTAALVPAQGALSLSDDLLIYLVAVVAVAVVGGFWPAVLAAVTASLLLNWYFTPPVHTFTIADPQNMLALLLFITVAVTVSSVVHLAARRAVQATRSTQDAAALLALAQTVLGGQDTPAAILRHLTATRGGSAELAETVGDQRVRVAWSGPAQADQGQGGRGQANLAQARQGQGGRGQGCQGQAGPARPAATLVRARADLALIVAGQADPMTPRLLDGFAAQAAAALDRDRLRTQAAQAEALAEGNRMRTALLAAVSHDLRTPLASIKASISTLRQAGVELTLADEAALLATVEESADRLNDLIGNLLDMSRLSTGSLEPFLRPASIDEVAPLACWEPGSPISVRLVVPEDLPLVRTDPGLLERVLANLFANAVAHSPPGRPPVMQAWSEGHAVMIDVVDHGRGVPDELKERIFEPFERLDERNSGTGVGLGLAVAKGFLAAIGGEVAALDTPGGGLTMRVRLPIADSASSAGGRPVTPAAGQ